MKRNELIGLYGKIWQAVEHLENCREFATMIPEVRTNLVYAAEDAKGPEDVLGIEGRITVINGMPYAAGRPKFGTSSHMARLIIEIRKTAPSIRAGINFTANPELIEWLEDYCHKKEWMFSVIDRSREPEEVFEKEGASMPWKVCEAVKRAGGKVPKVFCETGALGKEDLTVLVGKDPLDVAKEACEIASLYAQSLQSEPKIGKIDFDTFTGFLLKRLGKKDKSILVPPLTGVDAGVIDIGHQKVLIVAEDPIFSIPRQPLEMFGWYTVHIGASDVAVMGAKPRYMTYTLLMPPETSSEEFRIIVDSILFRFN